MQKILDPINIGYSQNDELSQIYIINWLEEIIYNKIVIMKAINANRIRQIPKTRLASTQTLKTQDEDVRNKNNNNKKHRLRIVNTHIKNNQQSQPQGDFSEFCQQKIQEKNCQNSAPKNYVHQDFQITQKQKDKQNDDDSQYNNKDKEVLHSNNNKQVNINMNKNKLSINNKISNIKKGLIRFSQIDIGCKKDENSNERGLLKGKTTFSNTGINRLNLRNNNNCPQNYKNMHLLSQNFQFITNSSSTRNSSTFGLNKLGSELKSPNYKNNKNNNYSKSKINLNINNINNLNMSESQNLETKNIQKQVVANRRIINSKTTPTFDCIIQEDIAINDNSQYITQLKQQHKQNGQPLSIQMKFSLKCIQGDLNKSRIMGKQASTSIGESLKQIQYQKINHNKQIQQKKVDNLKQLLEKNQNTEKYRIKSEFEEKISHLQMIIISQNRQIDLLNKKLCQKSQKKEEQCYQRAIYSRSKSANKNSQRWNAY